MRRCDGLAAPIAPKQRLRLLWASKTLQRSLYKNGMSLSEAVQFLTQINRNAGDDACDLTGVRPLKANMLDLDCRAAPGPIDTAEFTSWIDSFRQRRLSPEIRDAIFDEIYDYFDSNRMSN